MRARTLIVVDADRLAPEAIAQLVQGSQQGFYKGDVFAAILARMTSILKGDPDLKRLESDAEQEIAELKSGDEAVKNKLDQLIEGHHAAVLDELPEGAGATVVTSHPEFPKPIFTLPRRGSFEALLELAGDLPVATELTLQIEGTGPRGELLATSSTRLWRSLWNQRAHARYLRRAPA